MSEPTPGARPGPGPRDLGTAPETGVPTVDQAVAPLADLDSVPLPEHPERLAAAHAALHAALDSDQS